jgi:nitric oxide synthase-interacting protein
VRFLISNLPDALLICAFQVAQKKEIKRQKERIEVLRREEEEEKERVKESARQRVLRDFERGQLGLVAGPSFDKDAKDAGAETGERA